ncbi:hypothetical protein VMCG_04087 [Cytospora schulzeri]|uniref:Uncharacterized protein n=1 Tax=Cytospora schulzeri TaxID=448051 RepID=A0A423WU12_9PEZI|nr:hypothetical protein VMCG_04087 [Valsa malicola]
MHRKAPLPQNAPACSQNVPAPTKDTSSSDEEDQQDTTTTPPPYDTQSPVPVHLTQTPTSWVPYDPEVVHTIINVCSSVAAGARIRDTSGLLNSHNLKVKVVAGVAEALTTAVKTDVVDTLDAAMIAIASIALVITKNSRQGDRRAAILAQASISLIEAQVAAATYRWADEHLEFWHTIMSFSKDVVYDIIEAGDPGESALLVALVFTAMKAKFAMAVRPRRL